MIDSVVNRRPRHAVRDGDLGLVSAVATATASAVRNRVVVRIPAGTWATCSVNVCSGQTVVRHRQRRVDDALTWHV
jgi:hypothetical protein